MKRDGYEFGKERYTASHTQTVLESISNTFPKYYVALGGAVRGAAVAQFTNAINEFADQQERYLDVFDLDALEEYEYDPNSFKNVMQRDVPVIRAALNSPAEAMKKFRYVTVCRVKSMGNQSGLICRETSKG